jgi:hypothetical protein
MKTQWLLFLMPPINAVLARHRLQFTNLPIQWILAH